MVRISVSLPSPFLSIVHKISMENKLPDCLTELGQHRHLVDLVDLQQSNFD